MEKDNFVLISTYAKMSKMTDMGIRRRIDAGKIKCTVIDGIRFINLKDYPPMPSTRK